MEFDALRVASVTVEVSRVAYGAKTVVCVSARWSGNCEGAEIERNREWKGGEKERSKRKEIRDLLPSFDWKFLDHPPYCLGAIIILVLSLVSRWSPRNLMAQAASFHVTHVPYSSTKCASFGFNKKLIILHPFSVSNKQAVFYGFINAHNVSEPSVKTLAVALCSASRLRNFGGPSNYNIRAYFLEFSRHLTLLYQ